MHCVNMRQKVFPGTELSLASWQARSRWPTKFLSHLNTTFLLSGITFCLHFLRHSGKRYPVSGITFLHMNRTKLFDLSKCFLDNRNNICWNTMCWNDKKSTISYLQLTSGNFQAHDDIVIRPVDKGGALADCWVMFGIPKIWSNIGICDLLTDTDILGILQLDTAKSPIFFNRNTKTGFRCSNFNKAKHDWNSFQIASNHYHTTSPPHLIVDIFIFHKRYPFYLLQIHGIICLMLYLMDMTHAWSLLFCHHLTDILFLLAVIEWYTCMYCKISLSRIDMIFGSNNVIQSCLKAAFHFRVFHTHVCARKTLNRRKHYSCWTTTWFNVNGFIV